jgi:hypothetical protein
MPHPHISFPANEFNVAVIAVLPAGLPLKHSALRSKPCNLRHSGTTQQFTSNKLIQRVIHNFTSMPFQPINYYASNMTIDKPRKTNQHGRNVLESNGEPPPTSAVHLFIGDSLVLLIFFRTIRTSVGQAILRREQLSSHFQEFKSDSQIGGLKVLRYTGLSPSSISVATS